MRRRNAKPRIKGQAEARDRTLAAVARARRENIPISAAVKIEQTTLRTVRRHVPSTIRQTGPRGRIQVTRYDRIARTLNVLTPQGPKAITVRDSRLATRIAEYLNAVRAYSRCDVSALDRYRGKSFRVDGITHPFITDSATLDRLILADSLGIDKLYRSVEGH